MKCASVQSVTISLTCLLQGCKDVEENLGDLVLWLIKLKDVMAITSPDKNPEEGDRRKELTRFSSCPYCLTDSNQSHVTDP